MSNTIVGQQSVNTAVSYSTATNSTQPASTSDDVSATQVVTTAQSDTVTISEEALALLEADNGDGVEPPLLSTKDNGDGVEPPMQKADNGDGVEPPKAKADNGDGVEPPIIK